MKKLKSYSVLIVAILSIFSLTYCDKIDEIFNDITPYDWPWQQEGDEELYYNGEVFKFCNAEGTLTVEFGVEIGVLECTEDSLYDVWYANFLNGNEYFLSGSRGVRITYKDKEYKSRIMRNSQNRYAHTDWLRSYDGPYWYASSGKYKSNTYRLANNIEINLLKCISKTSMRISIKGQDLNITEAKVSQKN